MKRNKTRISYWETIKNNNFANLNILVAKGKEIKRDLVSSDERKLKSLNLSKS